MNPAAYNYESLAHVCGLKSDALIRDAVRTGELESRKPSKKVVLIPLQPAYEWALKNLQIDITKTTVEAARK